MIKANELRIGNLVNANGKISIVNGIQPMWLWFEGEQSSLGISKCEPITLSEEILLKVGFEKDEEKFIFYGHNECEYILERQKDWFFVGVKQAERISYFIWHIKYLHQFQNIYYQLTNKELKITAL